MNEKGTQKLKRIKNTKNLRKLAIAYINEQVNLLHQSEITKYLHNISHSKGTHKLYIYIYTHTPWWDFSQDISALSIKQKIGAQPKNLKNKNQNTYYPKLPLNIPRIN